MVILIKLYNAGGLIYEDLNAMHKILQKKMSDQIIHLFTLIYLIFRMLYWTDWGLQPKIEMSDTDGQNRQTIVDTDLGWPNGIAHNLEGNIESHIFVMFKSLAYYPSIQEAHLRWSE